MTRISWLCAAIVLAAVCTQVRADPWLRYHHCPKPSYNKINYWAPELFTAKAYLQIHPPFLYAVDRNPEIPYDFAFQNFPCPATYPQTLYSWPQLDNPRPPKPQKSDSLK